jgi:hypothetical protein
MEEKNRIGLPLQLFLTGLVAFNLLPLLPLVPLWVSVVASIALILKLLHLLGKFPAVPKKLIWAIGFAGFFLVFITKHTLFGEEASTAILFLLATCKLLETERYRDAMITVVFCFFLLAAFLLASQSLPATGYFLLDVILMMQVFLQLHPGNTSLFSFRSAGKILLIIFPIWILFFAIFPRFTVAFWQVERNTPVSTFSDEMNPGEISRLVQTDDLAFRADFEQDEMRPSLLYWRGAIFSYTEGLHWRKLSTLNFSRHRFEAKSVAKSKAIEYEIWLEPFFKKWAFTLDYPAQNYPIRLTDNVASPRAGFTYEFQHDVTARVYYSSLAQWSAPTEILSPEERNVNLQLPSHLEPAIKNLADQLKDPKGNAEVSITHLIDWFKANHFYYTLSPGNLASNGTAGLDTFLFQTHQGFCEHYAAAGAFLLRSMGIPARVVIGFQGGQRNDLGNYWIIKNKNAHAWSEAWVGDHWKRVDLVSAVSPLRLELGADFFQSNNSNGDGGKNSDGSPAQRSFLARVETRSHLLFDALEMQWIRFLVNYNFEFQQNLFSKIGFAGASHFTLFLALLVALVIFIAALTWWLRRPRISKDPVERAWQKFGRKLSRVGIVRLPTEGPIDFLTRLRTLPWAQDPSRRKIVEEITAIYIRLHYAKSASVDDLPKLRRLIRTLRLR